MHDSCLTAGGRDRRRTARRWGETVVGGHQELDKPVAAEGSVRAIFQKGTTLSQQVLPCCARRVKLRSSISKPHRLRGDYHPWHAQHEGHQNHRRSPRQDQLPSGFRQLLQPWCSPADFERLRRRGEVAGGARRFRFSALPLTQAPNGGTARRAPQWKAGMATVVWEYLFPFIDDLATNSPTGVPSRASRRPITAAAAAGSRPEAKGAAPPVAAKSLCGEYLVRPILTFLPDMCAPAHRQGNPPETSPSRRPSRAPPLQAGSVQAGGHLRAREADLQVRRPRPTQPRCGSGCKSSSCPVQGEGGSGRDGGHPPGLHLRRSAARQVRRHSPPPPCSSPQPVPPPPRPQDSGRRVHGHAGGLRGHANPDQPGGAVLPAQPPVLYGGRSVAAPGQEGRPPGASARGQGCGGASRTAPSCGCGFGTKPACPLAPQIIGSEAFGAERKAEFLDICRAFCKSAAGADGAPPQPRGSKAEQNAELGRALRRFVDILNDSKGSERSVRSFRPVSVDVSLRGGLPCEWAGTADFGANPQNPGNPQPGQQQPAPGWRAAAPCRRAAPAAPPEPSRPSLNQAAPPALERRRQRDACAGSHGGRRRGRGAAQRAVRHCGARQAGRVGRRRHRQPGAGAAAGRTYARTGGGRVLCQRGRRRGGHDAPPARCPEPSARAGRAAQAAAQGFRVSGVWNGLHPQACRIPPASP